MIEKGAACWDECFSRCCKNGFEELVYFFNEKGITYNQRISSIYQAFMGKNQTIIDYLISTTDNDWNNILVYSIVFQMDKYFHLALSNGAYNYE